MVNKIETRIYGARYASIGQEFKPQRLDVINSSISCLTKPFPHKPLAMNLLFKLKSLSLMVSKLLIEHRCDVDESKLALKIDLTALFR